MTRPRRALACAVVAAAGALVLAGCTAPEPMPTPSSSHSTTGEPTPTPTPTPEPAFDGTASDNQSYFDHLNRELIDAGGATGGAAFIDNLVEHGYPRENMEATPDKTAISIGADNIVFSIRFGGTLLLGQWGNIRYTSQLAE